MLLSVRSSRGELRCAALRSRFGPIYFARRSTEYLSHTQCKRTTQRSDNLWLIIMIVTKEGFLAFILNPKAQKWGLLQSRDLWIVLFIQKCYYNQCCPKLQSSSAESGLFFSPTLSAANTPPFLAHVVPDMTLRSPGFLHLEDWLVSDSLLYCRRTKNVAFDCKKSCVEGFFKSLQMVRWQKDDTLVQMMYDLWLGLCWKVIHTLVPRILREEEYRFWCLWRLKCFQHCQKGLADLPEHHTGDVRRSCKQLYCPCQSSDHINPVRLLILLWSWQLWIIEPCGMASLYDLLLLPTPHSGYRTER